MDFTVRRPLPHELPAVGAITVEAYQSDGLLDDDAAYLEELADGARRDREAEVWVAADDSGVLGSVTFCLSGTPFAELSKGDEAEFRMLGVVPSARRRGIAEALVRRCIERADELGCSALVLCSMREMAAAHRLYTRLGFTRLPERDWSPVPGIELLGFILPLERSGSVA